MPGQNVPQTDQSDAVPTSVMNQRILESLERGEVKKAQDASTNFTRINLREGSFAFQILPPEQATDDMLDKSLTNDLPQIIWEREPDSPAARWVPFQTVPDGEYIQGSKYVIPFARVITPKFEKDIDELRTYRMDLRRLLTDNSIKDGLKEIDGKFMDLVNDIVTTTTTGFPGAPHPVSGKIQWRQFSGGITRENLAEAQKMLPSGSTFAGFEDKFKARNYVMLMNDITAKDLMKFEHDEYGGPRSQDVYENGLVSDTIFGLKALYTIKESLVPTGTIYFFAEPDYLGKCFYMTDWTMYMKKEAFFISMFSYWLGGMAFGNIAGIARADFVE
jgi:hypothetical protein